VHLAAGPGKRGVEDGELALVTDEDGMEERCGDESIGVDVGAAGDGDQCQVGERVVSQAERANGTCRCGRGDPLIEVAGVHRLLLRRAWTQAVAEEGGVVGAGIEEQLQG
jgi:hypothetical protein